MIRHVTRGGKDIDGHFVGVRFTIVGNTIIRSEATCGCDGRCGKRERVIPRTWRL